jgi:hypothetical protein
MTKYKYVCSVCGKEKEKDNESCELYDLYDMRIPCKCGSFRFEWKENGGIAPPTDLKQ